MRLLFNFLFLFLFLFFISTHTAEADLIQNKNITETPINTLPNTQNLSTITTKIDYFQIHIPNQNHALGLTGIHVDINSKKFPNLFLGMGGYGALRGENSGFFALGLEANYFKNIIPRSNINLNIGVFLGTGGGHGMAARINNGTFSEVHINLIKTFQISRSVYFGIGPGINHVDFFNGDIHDTQFLINFIFNTPWAYYPPFYNDDYYDFSKKQKNLNINTTYFGLVATSEFPAKNSKNLSNEPMGSHLGLMGVEFGKEFLNHIYLFLNLNGAVMGNQNGYAEIIGGIGRKYFIFPNINNINNLYFLSQLGIGSAGGGNVNTGGGLVLRPAVGIGLSLSPFFNLNLLGGYLWAPALGNGTEHKYRAWTLSLNLDYYFNINNLSHFNFNSIRTFRIRLGNQLYTQATQTAGTNTNTNININSGSSEKDQRINLLNLRLDYFINPLVYLTGQTAFAYTGHAAGYFSGMMGLGLQTPLFSKTPNLYFYTELLAGAAGGAGLDIGSGLLIEPLIGINYQLSPYWGIYSDIGETISPQHTFRTPTISLGFSGWFGC